MGKKQCFVIQPFDKGKFEERYEDIFFPAIKAAQAEPYRVDEDVAAENLIIAIEEGIRKADVCFAEITSHNRNVWYELGYAIAILKPVTMVCEESCELPFDVRSRRVIMYKDKDVSSRHFEQLRSDITRSIQAALERAIKIEKITDPVSPSLNLDEMRQHTLTALVIIASNAERDEGVSLYSLKQDMNNAGFNDLATNLALRELVQKQFVTKQNEGYDNPFASCTEKAMEWLSANQDNLSLKEDTSRREELSDDDIPF